MKLQLIIVSITTVICTEIFHYPTDHIQQAQENCTKNSSIEATCNDLCALESSMMLTPEGNAINVKEFGSYYQKFAIECWTFKTKPTCKEAHDFLGCFYKKLNQTFTETLTACSQQCPVQDPTDKEVGIEVTHELLAENNNVACFVTCIAERMSVFNDDDTINMNCINPRIPFEFDAKQEAKECEDSNKVTIF